MLALFFFAPRTYGQLPSLSYPGYTGAQNYTVGTAISTLTPSNSGGTLINIGLTSTFAGSPYGSGYFNGTGVLASFTNPYGTAADASGNVYVADAGNNVIRKITSAGVVTTLAGSGSVGAANGTGAAATFDHPTGLCLDGSGNLYVADDYNNMIRKIVISTGVVTTLAGSTAAGAANGTGTAATFHNPTGLAYDGSANLYVADYTNNEIRKVVISTQVVTTFAGSTTAGSTNGNGTAAQFRTPFGIACDGSGNLYIADYGNNMIRKLVISTTTVTTLAGNTTAGSADGTGTAASFNGPQGVAVYGSGNIYVADVLNNKIRAITTSGAVTTYAGTGTLGYTDGNKLTATFASPSGLCVDASNNLYVGDNIYSIIRKITPVYYAISPVLPQGLTFNDLTGAISGTPTVESPPTNYTVTANSSSGSGSVTLNLGTGLLSSYDSGNRGFIQEETIKISGITADSMIYSLSDYQKQTTRVYFDGLGRTIQTVGIQASPAGNDIIQPMAYDNLGRQVAAYLPYAGQSTDAMGSYRSNAVTTAQPAFYNQTSQYLIPVDTAAHANQVYEKSPLQRLLQSGMVGTGYQPEDGGTQHYKTVVYRYNTSGDGNIPIWNPDGSFTTGNYYAVSALSVVVGTDEDGTQTLSFTDKAGHLILKRQKLGSTNLDTYYIYNMAGMLSYIVPPQAVSLMAGTYSLTATGVPNVYFHYIYDTMGRITQRKVPAKGTMCIVYDPMNRPVLTQDSDMRAINRWFYVKYDAKGRVINTGTYPDNTNTTLTSMQNYVNGLASSYNTTWYESRTPSGPYAYYTNNVFPTVGIAPLSYNYYDDYDVNNNGTVDFTYAHQGLANEDSVTTAPLKGVLTVAIQKTVGSGINNGYYFTKAVFYDKRGNPIQVQSNNQLNYTNFTTITDTATTVPDFMGVPQTTLVKKRIAAGSAGLIKVQTNITYDQAYRIKTVDQYYNGSATVTHVAAYQYNELGQVIQKNLDKPASTWLQNVDMRYSIRGQLLSINNSKLSSDTGKTNSDTNDLFGIQMLYDQADSKLGNTAYYNGKLSAVKWMSKDGSNASSYERAFMYYYDAMNRDTAAIYAERPTTSTSSFTVTHGWDENQVSYDYNGNIKTLHRNYTTQGSGSHSGLDALTYTYSSSNPDQLTSVNDGSGNAGGFPGGTGSYSYSGNGNLTYDPYKGFHLNYNYLARVNQITFVSSSNRYITYTYLADGTIARKQVYDNISGVATLQSTTDYIDGFVYNAAGAGSDTLSYFPTGEGRVLKSGGTFTLEFSITDQQGNVRVTFDNTGAGGTAKVKQENSYYPFGLIMPGSVVGTPTTPNKNLYNGGSEWQNDFSNLPDYYQTYYRNYDAALARWVGTDPEAETADGMTTYQYSGNNPIMYNDPLGNLIDPAKISHPAGGATNTGWQPVVTTGLSSPAGGSVWDEAWSQDFGSEDTESGAGDGVNIAGFWSNFIADANSYIQNNGADVDIHLNSSQISQEYKSYLSTGDNGMITNNFVNSDNVIQPEFGGDGLLHTAPQGSVGVNTNSEIGGWFHSQDGTPVTVNNNSAEYWMVNSASVEETSYAKSSLGAELALVNEQSQTTNESPSLWDKATSIYSDISYGVQRGLSVAKKGLKYARILENADGVLYAISSLKDTYDLATGKMSFTKWEMNQGAGLIGFIAPEVSIIYFSIDAFAPKTMGRMVEFEQGLQGDNEKNSFPAH